MSYNNNNLMMYITGITLPNFLMKDTYKIHEQRKLEEQEKYSTENTAT
jgi:hypothetical protein